MKAINWTLAAALVRTLLILGASTFVGAIALPLGADGTLPVSWAAWKPIVAVGLSAAAVAEWLWIRTHLSQAAQALGLPGIANAAQNAAQTAAAVAKTSIVVLGLGLLFGGGQTACGPITPAQGANDIAIGLQGAACALGVYATDTSKGMSLPATIADAVIQCAKYGVTEAQATGLFAAHRDAEVKEGFVLKVPPASSAAPATSAN